MALVQRRNCMLVLFVVLISSIGFKPLRAQLNNCPTGKTSWPELVGVVGCEAAATIKAENSAYKPVVIPKGTATPENLDCTRVFIYISGYKGLVSETPSSG
ncbi:hypothetical protein V2J09_010945 [Rumex salicifolius]